MAEFKQEEPQPERVPSREIRNLNDIAESLDREQSSAFFQAPENIDSPPLVERGFSQAPENIDSPPLVERGFSQFPSKEIQKPEESIAPEREPTPEPAITEYLNNEAEVFQRDRQILENSKHLNFVRRVLIPESNPLALEGRDPETGQFYLETHRMSADVVESGPLRGNWIVYPTIVEEEQGRLKRLDHRSGEAMRYALRTGEFINFGGRENEALDFSRDYKSIVPRFNEYFKDRWDGAK